MDIHGRGMSYEEIKAITIDNRVPEVEEPVVDRFEGMQAVEFKDLVGLHKLTGVDYSIESTNESGWSSHFEDASAINFVLDGVTYTAVENPNDGYRSSMCNLFKSDFKIKNKFKAVKVFGMISEEDDEDIIKFYDVKNGKLVLQVGTDNGDDYYPSFVSDFRPQNMSINDLPVDKSGE